jgi:hypothetical protein
MKKTIAFGEKVEGYTIPVLNERDIRASAGLLFLVIFLSLMFILFRQNFILIKYVITLFLTDFIIRVFVNPTYSPTLILGRLIVSRQSPEYVDAAPKKFAWTIGLVLSSIMFVLMVVINSYSVVTGIICLICLVFLFFESAFGICLGCLFYGWFSREKVQNCPGEICKVKTKHDIQKTSLLQLFIVFGFFSLIIALVFLLNETFSQKPAELWGIIKTALSK